MVRGRNPTIWAKPRGCADGGALIDGEGTLLALLIVPTLDSPGGAECART